MTNCPTCKYPLPEKAVFCEKCGTEMATGNPPPDGPALSETPPKSGLAKEIRADLKDLAEFAKHGLMDDTVPPAPRPSSQCDDLHIQYNTARIFVEGMILPFDFRITPKTDGISDICIEIRCGEYARVSDEPPEEPAKDLTMPVHLAFRAPQGLPGGRYPFEIYVGYKREGKQEWFVARQVHTMHSAGENAGKVIENVRIEIQNTIDQGHAGDINLDQNLSDYLKQLKIGGFDQSVEHLARFDLPPVWATLALIRCRKQSWQERLITPTRQTTPPAEACRTRITLRHGNVRWHLLSETSYQLGRNRTDCDIVTRFTNNMFRHNASISRQHFRIERTGSTWKVLDGGYDTERREIRSSAIGTYLDGEQLDVDSGASLTPGREHLLTLGRPESGSGPNFQIKLEVLSWDEIREDERLMLDESGRYAQTPPALILRSPYIPNEVFALIWHILPVRRLDPRLHSLCFIRRTEAFQVCGPKMDCTWLTPGRDARLLHETFSVSDYDQTIATNSVTAT